MILNAPVTATALGAQSCPPLCNPMDCSLPVSSVLGILQARILEWVAIPFSRGSFQPRIKPGYLALHADSLPSEPSGKPHDVAKSFFKNEFKKDIITIGSSSSISGYIPEGNQITILMSFLHIHVTAALLTITKTWKQAECPSVDEWIKKI